MQSEQISSCKDFTLAQCHTQSKQVLSLTTSSLETAKALQADTEKSHAHTRTQLIHEHNYTGRLQAAVGSSCVLSVRSALLGQRRTSMRTHRLTKANTYAHLKKIFSFYEQELILDHILLLGTHTHNTKITLAETYPGSCLAIGMSCTDCHRDS